MTTLEELKRLHAQATPEPWKRVSIPKHELQECYVHVVMGDTGINCGPERFDKNDPDARLIAAMRNALPHLLTIVEAAYKLHTLPEAHPWTSVDDAVKAARDAGFFGECIK